MTCHSNYDMSTFNGSNYDVTVIMTCQDSMAVIMTCHLLSSILFCSSFDLSGITRI